MGLRASTLRERSTGNLGNRFSSRQPHGHEPFDLPQRFGEDGLLDCGFEYRVMDKTENDDEPDMTNTRLYHKTTGIIIHPKNRPTFIPDGIPFDRVVQPCQDIAQTRVKKEFDLEWRELFTYEGEFIGGLVSRDYNPSNAGGRPLLIIITGKGKSRAGVLSVRELLISGLEKGSAMYHIREAKRRGWAILALDPNARGKMEGMEMIRMSFNSLHWNNKEGESPQTPPPIFILAHSAGGGSLVHYLLRGDNREPLRAGIRAIAFTDSTHSVQWANKDEELREFLQSRKVLYIRNCAEHPSDTFADHKHKGVGETHEASPWWTRRFGHIETVWAGTTDHAAMCWIARKIIWKFFDRQDDTNPEDWTTPEEGPSNNGEAQARSDENALEETPLPSDPVVA